ncbi:AraC family transcriptional regulator [Flavobacterium psychroterrae]|uniref:AraC family transcriptional regulator n=1 Tax=Flavobacterium psychroterrae TaxID=2133767 RepID=A0ABS5P9I9_9FLAO|nr:AraC family transcriptional regulator [Flavobacterium psychroterrae]MBS7230973.1 AraC family transcriptional regulator [Flavobacterium psychroterrae]
MKPYFLLVLFIGLNNLTTAQQKIYPIPDSLEHKSYKYLDKKIYDLKKDSTQAAIYLFAHLHKSKNEHNWEELMYAYQNILHQSPETLRIVYADSMIYAAGKSQDKALLGSAYLSRGIAFYGQKKYEDAYENYITANNYISQTNDQYLTFKVKHQIAQIKYYLGFYDEAISLFRECLDYFKDHNARAYINTIHSLSVCYNRIGNYGLCSQTNASGLKESKRLKELEMIPYFVHSEGINEYFKKNYASAISKINSALDSIKTNKDFANESVGYFYIGKSYWALGKKDKALPYFLKVDKIFQEKNFLRPDLREVYELLLDYYKTAGNLKAQLQYINQLLKADKVLTETHRYLIGKIHKEYDTKELLTEKEKIKKRLENQKYYDILLSVIIIILFTLSVILTYRHYKIKKLYKKRYDDIMLTSQPEISDKKRNHKKIEHQKQMLDIPQETINAILKQLEIFEKEKKYLAKDVRLPALAVILNANQKYISKVISHYKQKSVVEYTNDLKIDYLIELLKKDKVTRFYTNSALAAEIGFTSTQRFVKSFKTRTGVPTAYFIEQIKKESDDGSFPKANTISFN